MEMKYLKSNRGSMPMSKESHVTEEEKARMYREIHPLKDRKLHEVFPLLFKNKKSRNLEF